MSVRNVITDSMYRIADTISGTDGFPYRRPASDDGSASGLFQQNVSSDDLNYMFARNPLAKVIVSDVAEDVFDKGFKIVDIDYDDAAVVAATEENGEEQKRTETEDDDLNIKYMEFFDKKLRDPVIKCYKLARLHGYSLLLLGYADGQKLNEAPNTSERINFFQPIDPSWIDEILYAKNENDEIMLPVRIIGYKMAGDGIESATVHPQRVIHFENPGTDMMKVGNSALMPCFDDLTVLKHVTWGAGQTMWRSGNQLVTTIAPPRASPQQISALDAALQDINAQTALTLPYGTDVKTHNPTGLNPQPYAAIPLDNISAATRIPISILIGSQAGAIASSLTDARDYAGTLSGIQNNVLTKILTQIFGRLQHSHQLPYKKFKIAWNPTLTMSEAEQTLVDYRQALTARINNKMDQETAEFNEMRNAAGTAGPSPTATAAISTPEGPSLTNNTESVV